MAAFPTIYYITATCETDDGLVSVDDKFTDWMHNGKLIATGTKVAEDYFYEYFDKAPFKLTVTKTI